MIIKFIKPSYEIDMLGQTGIEKLKLIEKTARTCYRSGDKITDKSYEKMIAMLVAKDHTAMLEMSDILVKFTVSRAFSHELVRMRIASFAQSSQRYINYNGAMEFIIPVWSNIPECEFEVFNTGDKIIGINTEELSNADMVWIQSMIGAACDYSQLLSLGWRPEQARDVFPNAGATEINIKTNIREWRHILKLRTSPAAAPQMREMMLPLLAELKQLIPIVFDDI